ncbi:MAG: T9SS type A sorting domain-containing protein [Ignavibacteria bacterium]
MLDNSNEFLYITGEAGGDILTKKFNLNLNEIWSRVFHNLGFDRGMDLVISEGFVYVTGYITNSTTGKCDIILLKYDRNNSGNILWTKTFGDAIYDDQAFGITDAGLQEVFICGYETHKKNKKNIKVYKCNKVTGNVAWQTTYDGKSYDDVGTDILTDGNYLYVVGSTYQNSLHKEDIIQLTYDINNPLICDTLILKNKGREIPTSFLISEYSRSAQQKSRTSLTSFTDNILLGTRDYLIITLKGSEVLWQKRFDGNSLDDVPTSLAVYDSNLYITGYSYRSEDNSDFATIKYKLYEDGAYGWTDTNVRYWDYNGGKDQGSSIKVKDRDTIYVAGVSELANQGFVIKKYRQTNNGNGVILTWEKFYGPNTDNIPGYSTMQKVSLVEIDSSDNVYQINYMWNQFNKYYAIVKYDANGNVLFVTDNMNDGSDSRNLIANISNKITNLSNSPNPFNPVTQIKFDLTVGAHINLKIFDMSGKEIQTLVDEFRESGNYSETFDAGSLSSGVYFYSIYAGDVLLQTKKCLLVK